MFTNLPKPKIIILSKPPHTVQWGMHKTPCGPMLCGLTDKTAVCFLCFAHNLKASALLKEWKQCWPRTTFTEDKRATQEMINRIFAKKKISVSLYGTSFQRKVWLAVLAVPPGKVVSYADMARCIKKPKAVRAVGTALGANPVPVVIPCHRVIASDGRLGGFGGGLAVKRLLLKEEGTVFLKDKIHNKGS